MQAREAKSGIGLLQAVGRTNPQTWVGSRVIPQLAVHPLQRLSILAEEEICMSQSVTCRMDCIKRWVEPHRVRDPATHDRDHQTKG
jgi:hypothetical protein